MQKYYKIICDPQVPIQLRVGPGHNINIFFQEPFGSQIFQSGNQLVKVSCFSNKKVLKLVVIN